jgi:EAL domain-containing protein (putative c-di-GMP-specific phosphodiesterase class I)/DNA-binding NarL/FixJ family response regulator
MSAISVLIADEDPQLRPALAELIRSEPGLELVGAAEDANRAIELCEAHQPDVAVIDVKMPGGGGARAARCILEHSPQTKIVAYSAYDDRGVVLDMVRAGARSYLLKGTPAGEVVAAVKRAARGEAVLSPEVAIGVVGELATRMQRSERERMTRLELRTRIRRIIDHQELSSVFQPIVELDAGTPVGVEALSRFSDQPLQSPDHWFADAERAGLRPELELAAARAAASRLEDLPPSGFMSLNLSPQTLARYGEALVDSRAASFMIEITEHAAIDDYDALRTQLDALRVMGVRLAVDDAGAGFASLRHTLQLAPDFIKLDVSLTKGIDEDRSRRALAAGLIGFARELPAEIIAEGIETSAELETLQELGVRYGQGFFLAAPGELPLGSDRFPPT